MPSLYEQAFQRALWTFSHQTVFCPDARACVPLRSLPAGGLSATSQVPNAIQSHARNLAAGDSNGADGAEGSMAFLGPKLDDSNAQAIAAGALLL